MRTVSVIGTVTVYLTFYITLLVFVPENSIFIAALVATASNGEDILIETDLPDTVGTMTGGLWY